MPYSTDRHINTCVECLNFYSHKFEEVRQLKHHELDTHKTFTLQFLSRMMVDDSWPWNILWKDEANFHLNGLVNAHNCHKWGRENSQVEHSKPLHDSKVTVWCWFNASFIIGRYFFLTSGSSRTYNVFI